MLLERYTHLIHDDYIKNNIDKIVWDVIQTQLDLAQLYGFLDSTVSVTECLQIIKDSIKCHVRKVKGFKARLQKNQNIGTLDKLPNDILLQISWYL
ncbi:hypothetical protein EB118_11895 [bacterium]|nr:hypothetical protein [bacterium]